MYRDRAESLLDRFAGKRVLVVGDLMVDEYVWGHVSRVSPEAPVLVVDAESHTFVPGGAANVVHNLRALEAQVFVSGAIGRDSLGERLLEELRLLGVETAGIVATDDRPTTQKTRIVAGSQQVVRVDRERRNALPDAVAGELTAKASDLLSGCDALLFSDYDKGVLTQPTVRALLEAARRQNIVVTANPKPPSAAFYHDADVVTLNKTEAEQASGAHLFRAAEETFHSVGTRLRETLEVHHLLITRGGQGLTVFSAGGRFADIPAHRVEVFDVAGAGDSTVAALTLALAAGASVEDAAMLGNAAGGAVVRKVGVATAERNEIAAMFD